MKNVNLLRVFELILLALVYFGTAKLGQLLAIPPGNVTPVWLPSGIILVAILWRGYYLWPGVFLGAFMGNIWAYFDASSWTTIGTAVFAATANGTGDTLCAVVGAYLIERTCGTKDPFYQVSHVTRFILYGGLLGATISAFFGVTALSIAGFLPWEQYGNVFLTWLTGDSVGVLMITPVVIALLHRQSTEKRKANRLEIFAFWLILIFTALLSLRLWLPPEMVQPSLFMIAPILIWGVLRLGQPITFLAILVVSAMTVIVTAMGLGPFSGKTLNVSLIELQSFLVVLPVTLLILSATFTERQQAGQKLQELNEQLEIKVNERTQELMQKIEELTQTRQELVQSEKMASLGRLVAGFAHELNTPLGVAIGSASALQGQVKKINELMEQEEVDVDELFLALENINKGTELTLSNLERSANLVNSFKRTAVDQTFNRACLFLVGEIIHDTVNMLSNYFRETDINISVNCPKALQIISFPGALEQLLTNLLMNSFIHGFEEGKKAGNIQINVQCAQNNFHLEYSDNGKGIAPENLAKVFEPFFTTHRAHGGSGLGMYICYNLVTTQLQGTITCNSTLGSGVLFNINYPVE